MLTDRTILDHHTGALDVVGKLLDGLDAARLRAPSPCDGWDLRALLEHMIGQNHGFAAAVERAGHTDLDVTAFAPRPLPDADVTGPWQASAQRVADAFAAGSPESEVLLAEIDTHHRFPASTVVAMHLLDTVVHGWDVATALGRSHRPDDALVEITLAIADQVPAGAAREAPGAAFAPVRPDLPDDPWRRALALLGRTG